MRYLITVAAMLGLIFSANAQAGGSKVSVAKTPPVVTKTLPVAGDTQVDPATKEIRVTFSKSMKTEKMWSFVQVDKASYPKTTGKPKYEADGKTIVLPVKLEPGKSYAIWLNKGKFNAFRCKGNLPAVPYLLVFETKAK
ncbi:MAG: Ig-like domain-containing protein [Deltaproteobacteria bacterium]|nr:Ig-like domain-containing protein [Deltaproteobacteria bacterium]